MYLADSHTHTKYSFDGPGDRTGEVDALCRAAIHAGLSELALTDHYDVNGAVEGIYGVCDSDAVRRDVLAAKDRYAGRLYVTYGVELGQAAEYPEAAHRLLAQYGYEYVIGSLHNLRGIPDFYFFDYGKMTDRHIEKLFGDSLTGLCELCDFDGISTIAHFTYMHRYVRRAGREIDFSKFEPEIRAFYRRVIASGKALELNTSTLRDPAAMTLPTYELMRLYRACGGELVTCGSDAHGATCVGAGIREAYAFLSEAGFRYVTVFHDGKPQMNKLC